MLGHGYRVPYQFQAKGARFHSMASTRFASVREDYLRIYLSLVLLYYRWRRLPPRYVAIKVNANNYTSQESAEKELRITDHITKANPQHPGRNFVATF